LNSTIRMLFFKHQEATAFRGQASARHVLDPMVFRKLSRNVYAALCLAFL
jgi:hypothetical protein